MLSPVRRSPFNLGRDLRGRRRCAFRGAGGVEMSIKPSAHARAYSRPRAVIKRSADQECNHRGAPMTHEYSEVSIVVWRQNSLALLEKPQLLVAVLAIGVFCDIEVERALSRQRRNAWRKRNTGAVRPKATARTVRAAPKSQAPEPLRRLDAADQLWSVMRAEFPIQPLLNRRGARGAAPAGRETGGSARRPPVTGSGARNVPG